MSHDLKSDDPPSRLEDERKVLTEKFEAASADKNKCQHLFEDAVGMHSRAAMLASAVTAQGERLTDQQVRSCPSPPCCEPLA